MSNSKVSLPSRGRVLVVDDDPLLTELWKLALKDAGYQVKIANNAAAALREVELAPPEVIVTDFQMDDLDGIALTHRLRELLPTVPVILVTGFADMDTAVAAIRADVYDFLTKPVSIASLERALERAIGQVRLKGEVQRLRDELERFRPSRTMIGESKQMLALADLIQRAAVTNTTVLVTGETGSGKELVTRELHARSPRAGGPFVAVNCAALPEALLESELFGHRRGAFTDAREDRQGLFVEASGGSLFLDEIGDMPLPLQAKLLRVLQERKVRPLGANSEIEVDVRVIAATHRDLAAAVEERTFRQDLYYRLNVIEIEIPSLQARGGDVLLLAQHFIQRFAEKTGRPVTGLEETAARKLRTYDWPGNVRELENCIEGAVALTRHDQIVLGDLPARIQAWTPKPTDQVELISLAALERRHIYSVLAAVEGNKAHAATVLEIGRKTLYRKLARFEAESDPQPWNKPGR